MKQQGIIANWALDKLTVAEIESGTDDLIKRLREMFETIGSLKKEEVTFDNCIQTLLNIDVLNSTESAPLTGPMHVCTDKALRDAAVAAEQKLSAFGVEMSMRKDIFDNVCAYQEKFGLDGLSPEYKRFVEKTIQDGKRNGLHLDEKLRDEVKEIKTRISDLGTKFNSNLNEENTILLFTADELAGVPQDLIDSLDKEEDKCKVTLKYPHVLPILRKCRIPETRKKVETAFHSRCIDENTKILEELITLRHRRAQLLGYPNHAAYIQEIRMAKSPEKVASFLSSLAEKLQPLWKEELKEMLQLKEEECKKHGYDFNGKLDFWDVRYYTTMIEETKYSVDQEQLKPYYPVETVTRGLLQIYQQLLGLKFIECTEDVDKWHEEVKLYRVEDVETSELLGYFYLDLHPREGKYGHACVAPLQSGCIGVDGKRQPGVCVMLANFTKPSPTRPALLDHNEVETYFHEFGHVMHFLCGRGDTDRFTGYNTERDFVEAPSQMLENWCWEEESLKLMSGHYQDGSPIPAEILSKLIASRNANAGGFNLRQIVLATFDQTIHTQEKADTAATLSETYDRIIGIQPVEGTNMAASFGHMVGYDGQYYGYLWSEVFCFDMFEARFKKEGLLNPQVGMDYRRKILQPGGTRDAIDLLRDFLGRDPTDEAFLRNKGLKA